MEVLYANPLMKVASKAADNVKMGNELMDKSNKEWLSFNKFWSLAWHHRVIPDNFTVGEIRVYLSIMLFSHLYGIEEFPKAEAVKLKLELKDKLSSARVMTMQDAWTKETLQHLSQSAKFDASQMLVAAEREVEQKLSNEDIAFDTLWDLAWYQNSIPDTVRGEKEHVYYAIMFSALLYSVDLMTKSDVEAMKDRLRWMYQESTENRHASQKLFAVYRLMHKQKSSVMEDFITKSVKGLERTFEKIDNI